MKKAVKIAIVIFAVIVVVAGAGTLWVWYDNYKAHKKYKEEFTAKTGVKYEEYDKKKAEQSKTKEELIKESSKKNFKLLDDKIIKEKGVSYITGRVWNISERDLSYVQVQVNLYDINGNEMDTLFDNKTNLSKDGVWTFKILVGNQDKINYKIKSINGD